MGPVTQLFKKNSSSPESWISFLEIAQLPFNNKCNENMFRLCRLPLFSLSINTVASFSEIWLEAAEPFISPELTSGARRALA